MRGTCSAGEFEARAGDENEEVEEDDWLEGWALGRGSIKLSADDEESTGGAT